MARASSSKTKSSTTAASSSSKKASSSVSTTVSSSASSATSSSVSKTKGISTGIGAWYQMYDDSSSRYYFYNKSTKQTSWGLPLRESLGDTVHGGDDWQCCVDYQSGKKFYQSLKYGKVQWTMPLRYRGALSKLKYFQAKRVSMVGSKPMEAAKPRAKEEQSISEIAKKVSVEAVLRNATTAAALHRFCVATYSEENVLFYACAEMHRTGLPFHGMSILGVENEEMKGDVEGESMLQKQLVETRASVRIGFDFSKRMSAGKEARLIFDKFLRKGAALEVCISGETVAEIEDAITSRKKLADRDLFLAAQHEIIRVMDDDILPRFLRTTMVPGEKVGTKQTYEGDEVVRSAIRGLAGMIEL